MTLLQDFPMGAEVEQEFTENFLTPISIRGENAQSLFGTTNTKASAENNGTFTLSQNKQPPTDSEAKAIFCGGE